MLDILDTAGQEEFSSLRETVSMLAINSLYETNEVVSHLEMQ